MKETPKDINLINESDSLPSKIAIIKLKEVTNAYLEAFEGDSSFTINDYILMVKIDNSIGMFNLKEKDDVFKRFDEIFYREKQDEIVGVLGAKLSKGMGYYSKEHDLSIGGVPNINSYFIINYP